MSEIPIGAYYDQDRQIIVTGHQKGLLTGMMFGVVGVLVADSMNRSSGGKQYGAETAKGENLGSDLNTLLKSALAEGRALQWSLAPENAGLRLTPYAVFTVEKSGEAHLHAMLRAELPGPDGKPIWSGRYFARAPGSYPLTDDGWMNGDRFAAGMNAALGRALDICIDDTHGRLTGTKTITAKGHYPYLNIDLELRAIEVEENPITSWPNSPWATRPSSLEPTRSTGPTTR